MVEALANVGEPGIGGRIGVVPDHRDADTERIVSWLIERLGVDQAHRDAVHLVGDRRLHSGHHLGDGGGLRAGPLVATAQERAGILDSVDCRCEERVGRHMVDERNLVILLRQTGGGQRLTDRSRSHSRAERGRRRAAQPQLRRHAERLAPAHLVTGALGRWHAFEDILLH